MGERPHFDAPHPGQRRPPHPGRPLAAPRSGPSQHARARALGLATGRHTDPPRTGSQWVADPGRTPHGRAVGRAGASNPERPAPRQEVPPPRAPSCLPHSAQSQYPRARALGLVAGPHAHSPRTHSQWVTGPGRTPQGWAVRRGRAANPERPTPRQEMPRAPSCRPHSGQSQRAKAGLPAGERATASQARGQRDRATPRRAK